MQTQQTDNVITPEDAVTLHGLFLERVKRTPDTIAYRYFDARQEVWLTLTWAQALARWRAGRQPCAIWG